MMIKKRVNKWNVIKRFKKAQKTHVNHLKHDRKKNNMLGMFKQIYVVIGAHNKSANRMILIKVTCSYSLSDHHNIYKI